ncbi:MAG: hypothetical protein JWN40_1133 [Phycisphaerales bacterium]|nr:hypothetical protein [Phycisphaerales bacterium]
MKPSPEPTIEIIVSPTGQTRLTTRGYAGTACKDASRALERALGAVQSDVATPEMHQAQSLSQDQEQGR